MDTFTIPEDTQRLAIRNICDARGWKLLSLYCVSSGLGRSGRIERPDGTIEDARFSLRDIKLHAPY